MKRIACRLNDMHGEADLLTLCNSFKLAASRYRLLKSMPPGLSHLSHLPKLTLRYSLAFRVKIARSMRSLWACTASSGTVCPQARSRTPVPQSTSSLARESSTSPWGTRQLILSVSQEKIGGHNRQGYTVKACDSLWNKEQVGFTGKYIHIYTKEKK